MLRQLSILDRPVVAIPEPQRMRRDQAADLLEAASAEASYLVLWCVDNDALVFERYQPWTMSEIVDLLEQYDQDLACWCSRDDGVIDPKLLKGAHRRTGKCMHSFETVAIRVVA